MTIWRGEGGGGDATTDSEINLITSLANSIVADKALTLAAADSATASANAAAASEAGVAASAASAVTAASNAATSESNANASALNASNSAAASLSSANASASSAAASLTSANASAASAASASAIVLGVASGLPSIRPTLNLDFANSDVIDPRITFTRASTGTYYDSLGILQTAASGVARLDHDPVTFAAKGLLIEEVRTNLLTYSSEFDNAAWIKANVTVTPNSIIAPDGLLTADTLIESATNAQHNVNVQSTVTGAKTFTVYAKQASGTRLLRMVDFNATDSSQGETYFNLSTGVVSSGTGTISAAGNGWYRCSITTTTTVTSTYYIAIAISVGTFSYLGDGTSGIYIWGAQLEAGAFATSYIPTTTAQATRAADNAAINTLTPWYNAAEGTLYSEVVIFNPSSTFSRVSSIENSSYTSSLQTARNLADSRGFGDGVSINQGTNTFPINTVIKQALAGKVNDFALSTNGSAVAVDTTTNPLPTNVIAMGLGSSIQPSSYINGWLRRVTYYTKRLSNTELQALTA